MANENKYQCLNEILLKAYIDGIVKDPELEDHLPTCYFCSRNLIDTYHQEKGVEAKN